MGVTDLIGENIFLPEFQPCAVLMRHRQAARFAGREVCEEKKTEMTCRTAADGLIKLADAVRIVQEPLILIAGGFPLALEGILDGRLWLRPPTETVAAARGRTRVRSDHCAARQQH